MPTRRRTTAARSRLAAPRRKRIWARETHSFSLAPGAVDLQDLLNDYRLVRGITANDPGTTIGGVRGRLSVIGSTASAAGALDKRVTFGLQVLPATISLLLPANCSIAGIG